MILKLKSMAIKINYRNLLPALTLVITILASCKRYPDPPPYFETNTDTVTNVKRKILLIGIDGAVGAEYKKIQAPVLESLKAHSKYSFESVSDESTTDAASWKTIVSGVSFSKHLIFDSSFIYTQQSGGAPHAAIKSYPSFFNFILSSAKSDTRSSFISSWGTMMSKLVPEVEDKVLAPNDAAVKDSALLRAKNGNSDIIVVHFNGVAKAGLANGFSAASQGYKDAVLKVDGYIGELINGLKARPEYNKKEEWLVIITGTHGGTGTTYGGASQAEVNNLSFYYNERFKTTEFIRAGFNSVQIRGKGDVVAQIPDDGGLYNPNSDQQTISIKMKASSGGAYPHFFSKMEKFASTPGWSLFTGGTAWALSVRSANGESRIQGGSPNVFDNKWHTMTFKFMDSASKRWVVRYTDGGRTDLTDITTRGAVTSTSPLTIGWQADKTMPAVTAYFADCMIFNTALSDAEVAAMVCMTDIKQHPKYTNLIGYWPCNEGFGGGFRNNAPNAVNKDFILQGTYTWDPLSDLPCTTPVVVTGPTQKALLVKNVDIASTVFYWLKIPVNSNWSLDGSSWLSSYELEFVNF